MNPIKMARGETFIHCSYHEHLWTLIKTNVNKFAISSHTAFEYNKQALKGYLKLACEYGKNYMKVRPAAPLVHHLQCNRLLRASLE